jgi:hypothetical protein
MTWSWPGTNRSANRLERLYVEPALESLAHDAKVDLTKIQVEGVIVKVAKDKFPPQPSQK